MARGSYDYIVMKSALGIGVLSFVLGLGACGSAGDDPSGPKPSDGRVTVVQAPPVAEGEHAIVLVFGPDMLPSVQNRITELVTKAAPLPVRSADAKALPPTLPADSIVLSFGDTASGHAIDAPTEAEGFALRTGTVSGASLFVSRGHDKSGNSYGAYAMLERLGYSFLHPLAPTAPTKLAFPKASVSVSESPAMRIRGIHLHTMHPLELTDMLEGFPIEDEAAWKAKLPEWDRYLEWLVANRQNRVEWVVLWADRWKDFADSPARQSRFKILTDRAHAYGIEVGVDAAIALEQQHMFHLVREQGDLESEKRQIDTRLDWFFAAGFDFLSTENGSTEFTHPDSARMLAWMNEAALHAKAAGKSATIKAHCSTGQVAEGFADPVTGKPINFNFLPHYADPSLGVMPHTVEIYGLDDPAPTYGNTNFGYMKAFLQQEIGKREVIWHPETAYWVTYDIDVPLFLPVYAERRVSDLRILQNEKIDGQVIFSSGWEWGYWLNDVVAARAAWNPHYEQPTARASMDKILEGLLPDNVVKWVGDVAESQHDLLVLGKVDGVMPGNIEKRNGMAYLEGFDAMADVASLGGKLGIPFSPITQPAKVGLVDLRNPVNGGPSYQNEIAPLLTAMESQFGALAQAGDGLAKNDLVDDLVDAAHMTALRAKQVHGLYDYVSGWPFGDMASRKLRLQSARDALDAASTIVKGREPRYRVESDRIAGWRPNPTAYDFTYLWFVRSMYFWWRDEGKAVDAPINPCYANVMDPAGIALGEGIIASTTAAIRNAVPNGFTECLAAPRTEPHYPSDGLRSRP